MLRTFIILSTLLLSACAQTGMAVPTSKQVNSLQPVSYHNQRVDIQISGRTSKLNHIDIAFLGKTIPRTYSDNKIHNSRGYDWWVSKHFALKSDLPEDKVRLYLELLEMSYPHYVELFGMAPSNIANQRIAVVYGSSRERVREAMLDDGFLRGVHKTAGGETMFYNRAGYNFPSHREHHQRYIVIHETMHAFHMALNGHSTWAPNWITEGLADSIASHVYDPEAKELTVMVFDRAPMNYITTGLKQFKAGNAPSIEAINNDPALKRGLNFFVIHFLMQDPIRQHYFKRFLAKLMHENPHSDDTLPTANRLLKEIFPNWEEVERQFQAFVTNIRPTFQIKSGPWEQNGGAYWLRSDDSKTLHELTITPHKRAHHAVLDFPRPQASSLIDTTLSESIAIKIDFEKSHIHRGQIGIGLHAHRILHQDAQEHMIPLMLFEGQRLSLGSIASNVPIKSLALTSDITEELAKTGRLGMTITQQDDRLIVIAATKSHKQTLNFNLPMRVDLNTLSILGQGMNHKLTPYLSSHTHTVVHQENNNTDPWLYPQPDLILRAFNACENYATILRHCRSQLAQYIQKLPDPSQHLSITQAIHDLISKWQPQIPTYAAMTLNGIDINTYFDAQQPYMTVNNTSNTDVKVMISPLSLSNKKHAVVKAKTTAHIKLDPKMAAVNYTLYLNDLVADGQIDLHDTLFDGVYLSVSKSDGKLTLELSGPYSGQTSGEISATFLSYNHSDATKTVWRQPVSIAPYEHKVWRPTELNLQHYKMGILEISAILDVDGEPLKLTKRVKL